MPNPLDAKIGGEFIDIYSVNKDRSYLVSFLEHGDLGSRRRARELPRLSRAHRDPDLHDRDPERQEDDSRHDALLRRRAGTRSANGIKATVYRVNQDADQWHVLLAWRHKRLALHDQRARHQAVRHGNAGREEPRPHARGPRARPARRLMRLTRRRVPRRRGGRRGSAAPASTSSSTVSGRRPRAPAVDAGEAAARAARLRSGERRTARASRCSCRRCTARS